MPFIAPRSLQIHPKRSCPFGGRANISQGESACMKAHTRSPISTRRSNHAAYSNSPRTDNGDGVGANTSSTVVAKSFSTHLDLTSLPFNRRAQPVSRIDLLGGMSVSLTQEYNCRCFICWISRSSPALTLSGGQSVDQGASIACSNNQVCVRPSFLVDIEFHTVLATDVKNVSCHSCLLRHVFILDWFQLMRCRWSSSEVILVHPIRQVLVVCHRGCF